MNGAELLRVVDLMHREKNIPKDTIFNGIEDALKLAMTRREEGGGVALAADEEDIVVHIDRVSGQIVAQRGDEQIDPELLGRIAAQSAKQVMIQKIREAESDGVFGEFSGRKGEMVTGTVQRVDNGTGILTISKDGKNGAATVEAILPRSEQIPGETLQVNDRVKAVVMEVRRNGHRVKIVLSRCHPDFVKALFEQEIPEVQDRTIEIKAVAREAGYRSKVAVSSIDMKVDCVGACVGVRGSRIKSVIDEINGERIDIVRWNDSMQIMIPNSLSPAEISEVMLYHTLGRAIVLVTDENLSLAIGRRGQNVRLASKLTGWDIEIMTIEELTEGVEKAERWYGKIPNVPPNFAEAMITEGFLSYEDITFLEAEQLAEMIGISPEDADDILEYCEEQAARIEREGESEQDRAPVVPDVEPTAEEIAAAEAALAEEAALNPEAPAGGEAAPAEAAEAPAEPEPAAPELPVPHLVKGKGKGLDALFQDDPK